MQRRHFLCGLAASALVGSLPSGAFAQNGAGARIVVVGGGFAGATCARYLKRWAPAAEVVLIEAADAFVACPMSNRVIGGTMSLRDLTRSYAALSAAHGVQVVRDTVTAVDVGARRVSLARGDSIAWDRLVLAPGVEFAYDSLPGLEHTDAQAQVLHAWAAGPQTQALRRRLMALPQGGVFAMHIPPMPYRCPPGPYERACLVAGALQRSNPRAKVLVFDANPDVVAKKNLFADAFRNRYKGVIEYVPNAAYREMDAAAGTLRFDLQAGVKADLWNVIPPQRAGLIARQAGLANVEGRWCEVDFLSYESKIAPGVHVIGDAVASAPGVPKSAHIANQQAKVCAAAIAALLSDRPLSDEPMLTNTCYSFVNEKEAAHLAAVYRYDADKRTMVAVPGAGGESAAATSEEGFMAVAWAFNILNDTLGRA
ncbi:NAD(P)/FAD-dependent oxidoreductase [Pseudothauera hydrothermalis]|uniref:NAD(P)/FAD-dependent oxidoreductase n=1 Tax=Pseudothauera hydrothermalis TaxID=2184083 RepID=UPI000E092C62|nr:NAD(P)/FAD-dependent oxidoreductase [Pseudothauera hydrothermalis]